MSNKDREIRFAANFIRFGALSQLLLVFLLIATSIQLFPAETNNAFDCLSWWMRQTIAFGAGGRS